MKYYKNLKGKVYAFENEQERQEWGAPDLVEMTETEVESHLSPPLPPPPVPEQVTRAQGKYALHKFGYMPAVLTFMETLPESVKYAADLAFNDTLTWKRDSPFMQTMCDGVGLTDEQVDELFIYASKVEL